MRKYTASRPVHVVAYVFPRFDGKVAAVGASLWFPFVYLRPLFNTATGHGISYEPHDFILRAIAPTTLAIVFARTPAVLALHSIRAVLAYLTLGVLALVVHQVVVGLSIVDFVWYWFYYGTLAFVAHERATLFAIWRAGLDVYRSPHRFTSGSVAQLRESVGAQLKTVFSSMFGVATVLGVCLTILLSGESKSPSGEAVRSWEDWANTITAFKMSLLFILSVLYVGTMVVLPALHIQRAFYSVVLAVDRGSSSRKGR